MGAERYRVLMTADTVGGVWDYALELARALGARGDEVALATMGGEPSRAQRRDADAIPGLQLYPGRYRLMWMENPWDDVEAAGDWLLDLAERLRPDVVHLNDYAHGDLPWPAPVLVVGHSCVLSWWRAVHRGDAPADWARYRERVARGLRGAGLVAAPTRAMLAALERHYGALPRARVVANGRRIAASPVAARAPLILAAGRLWDRGKNLAALAAVAPQLAWPVCVAGEDRHPDGGRAELRGVRLLGRLPSTDLHAWMASASIYALPARYEPFGLSALEAAQAGCALVLGDIPSLREVWGEAASYVAPDDTGALRRALQRLIDDPPLLARHAARARQRAARYTPEAMAGAYRRCYAELVAGARPRPPVSAALSLGAAP